MSALDRLIPDPSMVEVDHFEHVADAAAYATFTTPGWIKVAWAIRVVPRGERGTRIELELRVDATDAASWRKFRRYFLLVGPGSRLIRRSLLGSLARELGVPRPGSRSARYPATSSSPTPPASSPTA